MNVVLYTDDMEPITVIDLPVWAENFMAKHGSVELVVTPIFNMTPMLPGEAIRPEPFRRVRIIAERFHRKGRHHMLLVTGDEESALLLKSAYLPGQYRDLQERERKALVTGFMRALAAVGRT